ncbi:ABC transporter substrate-binding protein [Natronolimnohabitans innermongolicus]|uniref:Oligopeptide ABC transporter solute-binding protein n=1 Tax=Natronolimnohabitans innermongolicus JCM 12255 TaxID=1227499 RepID=L9XD44_9EURY|nr:ABC transporter substrate-binding protein [Natronolimnohabitans innermongolicus]ELY59634.1 oligopeptide ABC transporter solute-binding protein [Natronolimnohabitans innermongolicus JCM 12255]
MVKGDKQSRSAINRRRVLQGLGAAGVVSIAGCLGGSDDDEVSFPLDVRLEVDADNDDRVEWTQVIQQIMEDTGYFDVDIEQHSWDDYSDRVLDEEYQDNGYIAFIGLSGTFNPESFCDALHGTANQGQCCNLNGLGYDELDEMIDEARFGSDVADDPELRAERYDEIWHELADYRGSSLILHTTDEYVRNTDVHGFAPFPFSESTLSYALHSPIDEQVMWLDRSDATPDETDRSDLQEGGTLRFGVPANIASFDPPYSSDTTSTMSQELIFEQLITSDTEGNLQPWLAESYESLDVQDIERDAYEDYMTTASADEEGAIDVDEQVILTHPDDSPVADDEVRVLTPEGASDAVDDGVYGMQWRYHLHEGIEFHDGEELTAENVVLSVERYENSDLSAQTFDSLLHARQVDEYTVDLYAQIPDAEAERELPGIYIHSTEQASLEGGDLDPRQDNEPVGTGPYVFEEFEDEGYFIATKNESYWLEEKGIDALEWFDGPSDFPAGPVIDEVDMDIIPEDSTRSGQLQNDEIDVTYNLVSSTLNDFDSDDDFIVDSIESGGYQYFQYPVNVEPWDDDRLRKAVNHLVPREQIVDEVLDGWGEPAWTMIPELAQGSGTTDYDALESELKPHNEFDTEEAIKLIEEVIDDRGYESDV